MAAAGEKTETSALGDTLKRAWNSLRDLYWSSPRTTFLVLPLTVIILETLRRRRVVLPDLRFSPLLLWGYLQYRLAGRYRARLGGGSGGMRGGFPDSLVTSGPYGYTRNPMYLGHLIYALGVVLVFRSPMSAVLAATRLLYFQLRVARDEERLEGLFGDEYRDYRRKVRRWIPGVL